VVAVSELLDFLGGLFTQVFLSSVPLGLLLASAALALAAAYFALREREEAEFYRELFNERHRDWEEERRARVEAEERARRAEEVRDAVACDKVREEVWRDCEERARWRLWSELREQLRYEAWMEAWDIAKRIAEDEIARFLESGESEIVYRVVAKAFESGRILEKAKDVALWKLMEAFGKPVETERGVVWILPKRLIVQAGGAKVVDGQVRGELKLKDVQYAYRKVRGRFGVYAAHHTLGIEHMMEIAPGIFLARRGGEFYVVEGPPTYIFTAANTPLREGIFVYSQNYIYDLLKLIYESLRFRWQVEQLHKEGGVKQSSDSKHREGMP
jgi:hypothetical protein